MEHVNIMMKKWFTYGFASMLFIYPSECSHISTLLNMKLFYIKEIRYDIQLKYITYLNNCFDKYF